MFGRKERGWRLLWASSAALPSNAEEERGSHDLQRLEKIVCISCRNAHTSVTTSWVSGYSEPIIWLLGNFVLYQMS